VARKRGEVYRYDYGGAIKERPCVVVSLNTNSNTVMVAEITHTAFTAPYVVPVEGMHCSGVLSGYVRCDHVTTLLETDQYWKAYITTLDADDMRKVDAGLRSAFSL
jgi:mRNA-degrading endonuclease toxin of MazEF toxin-antitoxin module